MAASTSQAAHARDINWTETGEADSILWTAAAGQSGSPVRNVTWPPRLEAAAHPICQFHLSLPLSCIASTKSIRSNLVALPHTLPTPCMYPPAPALPDLQAASAAGKRVPPQAMALTEQGKLARAPDDFDKAVTYGAAPSFTLPVALEGLEHPYNWSTRRWVSSIEGMSGRRRSRCPVGLRGVGALSSFKHADCTQSRCATLRCLCSSLLSLLIRAVYTARQRPVVPVRRQRPARKWLITLQAALLIFSCKPEYRIQFISKLNLQKLTCSSGSGC